MADEEDQVEAVETQQKEVPSPQPETPAEASAESANEETVAEEASAEPAAEEPEQEDWRAKELRRKHAQIKERDRLLAERDKEISDLRALAEARAAQPEGAAPELPRIPVPQNMTQAQIQEAAKQLRDQEKYDESIIATNTAGEKAYGKEWGDALTNLATLTDEVDVNVMRGIMATDAPEKVLYELGKNPSQYQRIMELPPERRQTEFVKLSLKQDAPKPKPSNAPAPTEPVQARVQPSTELSDKDDDETWYKKRAAMRAARRKERVGA